VTGEDGAHTIPRAVPRAQYRRKAAPRVAELHARRCALSRGQGRRCTCEPVYVARVKRAGSEYERTFAALAEASAWAEATKRALRSGGAAPERVGPAPALADVAVSFLHRARASEALTRSRRPYSAATLAGYESALRLRVLPLADGRSGLPLAELPVDALDGRTLQALVDVLAARDSAASARVAAAALAAVLRDAYGRGLVDELPPRLTLPPPPRRRERTLALDEADRLLGAAQADDARLERSLLGPLVALLVGSGCRVSEALGLDWGPDGLDLADEPPVVRIGRASTKSEAGVRRVPLDSETAGALRRHFLASGRPPVGAPVFADENGRRLPRHGRVRFGLERVARAAGLSGVTAHVFRHAHASWLASAGVPASVAAARLGHADGGVLWLGTYAHPAAADATAALDALSALKRRDARATAGSRRVQRGGSGDRTR